ncbi:aminotransferase class I/II-fold pyridoxal phosphate-dependent enzyme [Candidatus Peribacteria bacterium]|nr:aminotransferase class I/II-fold pyridoxal phosphate-dependent enzyme [Candidatus Peribacteria bacterium]
MSAIRPIHHTFAPLGDRQQRMLALRLSYLPWRYKRGPYVEKLRAALEATFNGKAFLFASGREALLAFLRNQGWNAGDEVIVQGYTCAVVPNAILRAGLTPVYADIDARTLNLDPADTERRITPRTRAVICQHTFGIPAPTEELRALCTKHNILLIEDCAHVLPDSDGPKEIGKLGDALLLSFGRDKAISGITGGAVIIKNQTMKSLTDEEKRAGDLPLFRIGLLLEYPQIYALARPLYGCGIGKLILWLAKQLHLLIPILTPEEKHGTMPSELHHMPDILAALALDQLNRLKEINDHRCLLTGFYLEQCAEHGWPVLHGVRSDLPLQKFPMFVPNAEKIRRALKKKNIHLHDGWSGCVICPTASEASSCGYADGTDPRAEEAGEQILSLPTHPGTRLQDAEELVRELRVEWPQ